MSAFGFLERPALAALLAALDSDGEEARVVGGAVRNAILGEALSDIDIATTALPATVIERAAARGWQTVPIGIEHGTMLVLVDGTAFEVTTLREDIATDGRHAVVRFGRDFIADAMRRDFTMNALSVSRDKRLHDVTGGEADARARRVRFIGDARTRITEDYLRILRFFRFHARYGTGAPDEAGLAACVALKSGLSNLSRERIRAEMLKLLAAPGAVETTKRMEALGFLPQILGGKTDTAALARLVACDPAADEILRLAALSLRKASDIERLADQLRLTRAEIARLQFLSSHLADASAIRDLSAARKLAFQSGKRACAEALLLTGTLHDIDPRPVLAEIDAWSLPVLPWRGGDFAKAGLVGPAVGAALAQAEAAFIAADYPDDPVIRNQIFETAIRDANRAKPA